MKTKNLPGEQREQVPLSMAIKNVKLMHKCFPKYLHMEIRREQWIWKEVQWHKKKSSQPNCSSGLSSYGKLLPKALNEF